MAEHIPEEARNFKLIGHDSSAAWGGGSIVEYNKGFVYVGAVGGSSFNGPEGFTVHDVRDPKNPRKAAEVKAPPGVHMHKLRVVDGDILYVNSERLNTEAGRNARVGLFIFDISKGGEPKQIGFYDMPGNGPHRFGVDNKRKLAMLPCNAPGWKKRVIWTLDIKNPETPEVVSIWGLPWMKDAAETGEEEAGHPHEETCTLHGPPMIRGNRMYAAWWGGGISVIDCSNLADMKLVGHLAWAPPFPGSNHTCWPIGDKPYLIVTDEARAKQKYWDAQFMWIIDARKEDRLTPIATFMPDRDKYYNRPGRYGAHNILEREIASEGPWKDIVFLTYFNAGLRAVNVADPFHPKDVGCYVPALENDRKAVQSNDIGTDDRGLLYLIDRAGAGMHILEYTG